MALIGMQLFVVFNIIPLSFTLKKVHHDFVNKMHFINKSKTNSLCVS